MDHPLVSTAKVWKWQTLDAKVGRESLEMAKFGRTGQAGHAVAFLDRALSTLEAEAARIYFLIAPSKFWSQTPGKFVTPLTPVS